MEHSDYFYWLCEMVCIDGRYNDQSFYKLAEILFEEEYYWSLDYDDDRAGDGLELRSRYRYEGGEEQPGGMCSVFEMLIALADRMEQLMDELDGECKTPMFFWEMIENLHLDRYSDELFEHRGEKGYNNLRKQICSKLYRWMDRHFRSDGDGGLFPLKNPRKDQREVDYWYQANAYLTEHYQENY